VSLLKEKQMEREEEGEDNEDPEEMDRGAGRRAEKRRGEEQE
jgi:hypothetical protein